jgi:hypothetical protein
MEVGEDIISCIHLLKNAINLGKRTVVRMKRLRKKKERQRIKQIDHSKLSDLSRNEFPAYSMLQIAFVRHSSLEKL